MLLGKPKLILYCFTETGKQSYCPNGTYLESLDPKMEQKFGVKAVCLKCDPLCKNCKGSGNNLVRTNAIKIL